MKYAIVRCGIVANVIEWEASLRWGAGSRSVSSG